MEQRVPQPDGGHVVPCVTELGQEGTDGRDFSALPGLPLFCGWWSGSWNGFKETGDQKVASRGPKEVGNRRLTKGSRDCSERPGALPPRSSQTRQALSQ